MAPVGQMSMQAVQLPQCALCAAVVGSGRWHSQDRCEGQLGPRQPGGAKPWVRTADAANIAMWPLKSERA